jgi:hypothetical protein
MVTMIKQWFAGKRGKNTTIIVLAVALAVSIIGQAVGWSNLGRLITGTTGPGLGGYSCMPTCVEDDGKFLSMPGENMASFGGAKIVLWIEAPVGQSSFEIGIFDGDSGKTDDGTVTDATWEEGNWDNTLTESTYTLYADPERDGVASTVVGQWFGNSDPMPNNDWYNINVSNVSEARNANGKFYYRLEATRPIEGSGVNAFKVRSTGQISGGRANVVDANFAIIGMLANINDARILYPEFDGDMSNLGPSTYSGEWEFYFDVPAGTKTISFWDGDFDRGGSDGTDEDTDDPNTTGKPPWALPSAVNERAGGQGAPPDDFQSDTHRRTPPAQYEVIGPQGQPIFLNPEPSGTEEWELFVVTSDPEMPDEEIDLRVDSIPSGIYTLRITGLDLGNTVWFRMNYVIGDDDCPECPICEKCKPCDPCECATATPTNTPEPKPTSTPVVPTKCPDPKPVDLMYVVDVSASMDMLYPGSGTKLGAAQSAIYELNQWVKDQDNGSRVGLLTFHSAGRGRGSPPLYPTDIKLVSGFTTDIDSFNIKVNGLDASGATPTAAALNEITDWLPGAWDPNHLPVVILISDGVPTVDLDTYYFGNYDVQKVDVYANGSPRTVDEVRDSGKMYDVYNEKAGEPLADTMLAIQNLESTMPLIDVYAVAIQAVHEGIFSDQILRYAAEHTGGEFYMVTDTTTLVESLQRAYVDSACGESEPPGGDAKAALPSECANTRTNLYHVENTTNKPFRSIKYEYKSGTEIKSKKWDEFQFTITGEEAAALTQVKIQAKAGRTATATIKNCDFAGTATCGPVTNRRIQFSFRGAVDNGNGTMTLTFRVQNNRGGKLEYVAIGLPEGVTPIWPDDTYQSEVCLD